MYFTLCDVSLYKKLIRHSYYNIRQWTCNFQYTYYYSTSHMYIIHVNSLATGWLTIHFQQCLLKILIQNNNNNKEIVSDSVTRLPWGEMIPTLIANCLKSRVATLRTGRLLKQKKIDQEKRESTTINQDNPVMSFQGVIISSPVVFLQSLQSFQKWSEHTAVKDHFI